MIDKEFRDSIEQPCTLFSEPAFDNSIIGFTLDGNVVYDFNAMINELAVDENWTTEEAHEFIDSNTIRTLPFIEEDTRPIIMYFREDI